MLNYAYIYCIFLPNFKIFNKLQIIEILSFFKPAIKDFLRNLTKDLQLIIFDTAKTQTYCTREWTQKKNLKNHYVIDEETPY
jgi:hypothetical protein